jgi:Fe-S-cluster containining protein
VDDGEVAMLASFLKLDEKDFIEQHTRLRWDRRGLALNERTDGSCIFLNKNNCEVQSVKPQQCKDFPNRWVNELWGKVPMENIQAKYPMLFNCSGFKKFLGEQ